MKNKGLLEEDNKVKISDKSIVVSSFEGLRDIFKDVKNHKEKNPSYYDNDKSDGMTVDKNGNIKFHGKKGLKIMEKRKEDGLSITNIIEPRLNTRKENKKGGILQDDDERYGMKDGGMGYEGGGLLNIANKIIEDTSEDVGYSIYQNYTPDKKTKIDSNEIDRMNNYLYEIYDKEVEEGRTGNAKRIAKRIDILEKEKIKLESSRNKKQEGGSIDDQMLMVMTPPMKSEMESKMPMESDDDMEDNYTRFIMEEALSEEEEDMLTSKLEQDEELSMLFDKIIDVAQEFAGSGPVEGPGSGVSDSIPARLSDGEFVFTAKAVEEIGEDTLMSMMKEAEAAADERQGFAEGELVEEETVTMPVERQPIEQNIRVTKETVGPQAGMLEQDDLVDSEVKKSMFRQNRFL